MGIRVKGLLLFNEAALLVTGLFQLSENKRLTWALRVFIMLSSYGVCSLE